MIEIPIVVTGDWWVNPEQVRSQLDQSNPAQTLLLDLRAEGPSLGSLGILKTILQHCEKSGRSLDSIWIKSWSNNVETIPFKRADHHLISHFFWLSERYTAPVDNHILDAKMFGFFVGRKTVPRMKIMKDLWDLIPEHCFLSIMNSRVDGVWPSQDLGWIDVGSLQQFEAWAKNPPILSVDDQWIHNQYLSDHNTNRDLLAHYPKFKIEIVAETYCLGECFFPTEKTVRPIVGCKPMLIYGPRFSLKRLRELGFRTWSDHWDESYDLLEGPKRWQAMLDVIKDISDQPDTEIVQHNQQHLGRLIRNHRPR